MGYPGNNYGGAVLRAQGKVRGASVLVDDERERTCYRCGVTFDATDYVIEAPCIDCQYYEDEPEYGWLKVDALTRLQRDEFARKRNGMIRMYYDQGYDDAEIGRRIGLSHSRVRTIRAEYLKLPVNPEYKNPTNEDDWFEQNRVQRLRKKVAERNKHEEKRQAHAEWRLLNGWPEETAIWQIESMKEARLDVHRHQAPVQGA